jgi:hypothetical protein
MATTKDRQVIYLGAATAAALADYHARRRGQFKSVSATVEHLLQRALLGELDEGMEGLLAPVIARRVEEAAARAVEERVATLLRAQTDRLAALLVRSGKDALGGYGVGVAILERLTGDPAVARRLAEEARLAAGPAYTARGLRGDPGQG